MCGARTEGIWLCETAVETETFCSPHYTTCTQTHKHKHTHTNAHAHAHTQTHTHIQTHTHTHKHTCTHTHAHTHTHTHTHTHIQIAASVYPVEEVSQDAPQSQLPCLPCYNDWHGKDAMVSMRQTGSLAEYGQSVK